jgi:hypothetical protein
MQISFSQNDGKDGKDIQADEECSLQQSWADEEIEDSGGQMDGDEGGERRYKRRPFTQVELENLVTGVKRYSGSLPLKFEARLSSLSQFDLAYLYQIRMR